MFFLTGKEHKAKKKKKSVFLGVHPWAKTVPVF